MFVSCSFFSRFAVQCVCVCVFFFVCCSARCCLSFSLLGFHLQFVVIFSFFQSLFITIVSQFCVATTDEYTDFTVNGHFFLFTSSRTMLRSARSFSRLGASVSRLKSRSSILYAANSRRVLITF